MQRILIPNYYLVFTIYAHLSTSKNIFTIRILKFKEKKEEEVEQHISRIILKSLEPNNN